MQPEIDLYSAIMLLGAVQGMFLALALINAKSGLPVAHRLLAMLTLTFSIDLWMAFLHQSGYITSYPRLLVIDTNIDFLFGPLTYLYVTALTARSGFRFTLRQWRHFLPFLFGFAILIPLMLLDQQQLQSLLNSQEEPQESEVLRASLAMILVGVLSILQMALYLGLSIKRLLQHQNSIEDQFSFLEKINLAWLRNLLLALVALYLFYLADVFLADLLAFPEEVVGIHFLMIVLVIYSMGYMGLRQPAIFTQQDRSESQADGQSIDAQTKQTDTDLNDTAPSESQTKYQRSALDSETSQLLYKELQNHMDEQRTFLDSKLTLPQLAAQLSISPNYLSQVINEQAECNFFDFINRYRVEEAQRSLTAESGQVNILSIALDAGFNSKSAFYTAFQRHTGQTPSEYRKSAANQTDTKQVTD
ncbi:MAG: helix-turn-helix domain-containing protein [Candidatus Thiodiazotropha taylori]|nr:helix-turn-helix domain-containing protein [Candidatus Thiodiazotropha taylori]MCW4291791.1 helix-turn-helix domain-containing protein [Candidatus Thiodiazotropha taylori]